MSETSTLGHASLSSIKKNLDRIFGKDKWLNWELETISDELKVAFDELARDKIQILQIMSKSPKLIFEDMSFFLHAVEVMNNKGTDFFELPMPSSLELAFALKEIKNVLGSNYVTPGPDDSMTNVIGYLIKEDGFSEPLEPFQFVPKAMLTDGQSHIDTEAKKKAIELYVQHMETA